MAVLLVVGVVVAVVVLYIGERVLKARARGRRLRMMSRRLAAAAARAEEQHEHRQAVEKSSAALTSYIPAINEPPLSVPGAPTRRLGKGARGHGHGARDHGARDRAGREHGPGGRASRTGEHPRRPADRQAHGTDHGADTGPQPTRTG